MSDWQPIETCPQEGLFIVHEDGAIRMMFRVNGEWQATAVAIDAYGCSRDDIKVRETGVYSPTDWMPFTGASLMKKPKKPTYNVLWVVEWFDSQRRRWVPFRGYLRQSEARGEWRLYHKTTQCRVVRYQARTAR